MEDSAFALAQNLEQPTRGVDMGNFWGANLNLPTKKTPLNRGVNNLTEKPIALAEKEKIFVDVINLCQYIEIKVPTRVLRTTSLTSSTGVMQICRQTKSFGAVSPVPAMVTPLQLNLDITNT